MDERARTWWPALHALMQVDLDASGAMNAVTELVSFDDELKLPVLRVAKAIAAHRLERADARRATALLGPGLVQFAALGFGFRLLARGPEQKKAIANEIAVVLAVGHVARAIEERRRDADLDRSAPGLFTRAALAGLPRLLIAIADFRMLADLGELPGLQPPSAVATAFIGVPLSHLADTVVQAWARRPGTLETAGDDPVARVALAVVAALVRAGGAIDHEAVIEAMGIAPDTCEPPLVRAAVTEACASFADAVQHLQLPNPLAGERWPIEPPPAQDVFPWPCVPSAETWVNRAPENAIWCAACAVRALARPDSVRSGAEAMELVLATLVKGMGYGRALVFLRDANGDMRVREAAGRGTKPLIGKLSVAMQGHRSPLHEAISAGEIFAVPFTGKTFDTPVWVDQALPGAASLVVVPIVSPSGARAGFIYADRDLPDPLLGPTEQVALRRLAEALAKSFAAMARARKAEAPPSAA
jgi:hypothetical protein